MVLVFLEFDVLSHSLGFIIYGREREYLRVEKKKKVI